jgi:hypothetical protein
LSALNAIAQKYRTMNVVENILNNYSRREERKKEVNRKKKRTTRKKKKEREAKRKKQFCLVPIYPQVLLTTER